MPGAVTSSSRPRVAELERRLRERATESAGEIGERLDLAESQLAAGGRFDHVVENDDLAHAVDELVEIVDAAGATGRSVPWPHDPSSHRQAARATSTRRYALVIVAAKRARQINNYHHQLGEGTFEELPPPLVESRSKNYLTMALEEIAEGKIKYTYPS